MNNPRHLFIGTAIAISLLLGACAQKQENPAPHTAELKVTDLEKLAATDALRTLADDVWADYLEQYTYYRLQEGLPISRFEDLTLQEYRLGCMSLKKCGSRNQQMEQMEQTYIE